MSLPILIPFVLLFVLFPLGCVLAGIALLESRPELPSATGLSSSRLTLPQSASSQSSSFRPPSFRPPTTGLWVPPPRHSGLSDRSGRRVRRHAVAVRRSSSSFGERRSLVSVEPAS